MTAAPLATLTVSVVMNEAAFNDLDTFWRQQISGVAGSLAAAVASGDSAIQVTVPGAVTLPSLPFTFIVDIEPMIVTAISGSTWTVTRGGAVSPFGAAAAHLSGATVSTLSLGSNLGVIAQVVTLKLAAISSGLATVGRSVVFGVVVTGTASLG